MPCLISEYSDSWYEVRGPRYHQKEAGTRLFAEFLRLTIPPLQPPLDSPQFPHLTSPPPSSSHSGAHLPVNPMSPTLLCPHQPRLWRGKYKLEENPRIRDSSALYSMDFTWICGSFFFDRERSFARGTSNSRASLILLLFKVHDWKCLCCTIWYLNPCKLIWNSCSKLSISVHRMPCMLCFKGRWMRRRVDTISKKNILGKCDLDR